MSTATKQESCFGHQFADPRLLDQALTHRSAASHHNERLEFLGDAVLNYLIAEELFRRSPQSAEGDLSRLRAWLVRGSTLADIGAETGLGSSIALGSGERRSGGQRRRSILADTVEAVLGAILLDGGIEAVRQVVQQLFRTRLESLPDAEALRDPKTRLQEWLQARGQSLPVYAVEDTTGPPHARQFTVSCSIDSDARCTRASGASRRKAEQAAASLMLEALQAGPA